MHQVLLYYRIIGIIFQTSSSKHYTDLPHNQLSMLILSLMLQGQFHKGTAGTEHPCYKSDNENLPKLLPLCSKKRIHSSNRSDSLLSNYKPNCTFRCALQQLLQLHPTRTAVAQCSFISTALRVPEYSQNCETIHFVINQKHICSIMPLTLRLFIPVSANSLTQQYMAHYKLEHLAEEPG